MNWYSGLTGYLEIALWGKSPERVINMALSRGIYIWDIRRDDQGSFVMKIQVGAYKALRVITRRSSCRIKILNKRGAPFVFSKIRKRKFLALGLIFFCAVLYILSSFVWFIDVSGNKKVPAKTILEIAGAQGLHIGAPKYGLDRERIKDGLLTGLPELAWTTLHIQGTRVVIEVAEKTLIPKDQENQSADILARVDGKIEELLVLKGTSLVKEGDMVQKGQPLIAGLVYPQIQINQDGSIVPGGTPEKVRAKGLIRARVVHKKVGECQLKEEVTRDTGRETAVMLLRFGDQEIILKGPNTIPYERYRQVSQTKTLLQGRNTVGPVELVSIIHIEQACEVHQRGLEEAYMEAVNRARNSVHKELSADCRIITDSHEPLPSSRSSLVRVQYIMETVEDIGCYPPIADSR